MSLETGSRIQDLVATNPVGATDFISQGDDHIRLIKACVQGSFPSLGSDAVTVTAAQINGVQAQLDAKQPLDTDLSAIAALTTSSHGRGFLTQADAAASRSYIGAQADDADLTAIAALTTTTYGRDFLALADNAALATKIATAAPYWSGNAYTSSQPAGSAMIGQLGSVPGQYGLLMLRGGGTTNQSFWATTSRADGTYAVEVLNDALTLGGFALEFKRTGITITEQNYGNATDMPAHNFRGTLKSNGEQVAIKNLIYRAVTGNDSTQASDVGGTIAYTGAGGHTFTLDTNMGSTTQGGGILMVMNFGGGPLTIAIGAGTLRWFNGAGSFSSGSRTLAVAGVATVWYDGSGNYYVWGVGVS